MGCAVIEEETELSRPEPTTWQSAMAQLRVFAEGCDGLKMDSCSLVVPASARASFYRRVGDVQRLLMQEALGARVEQARAAARLCEKSRRAIIDQSDLRAFVLPAALEGFLEDPEEALMRPAFSCVLDGLQGRATDEEMAARAFREIESAFGILTRCAYESWAYYGIVAGLRPRRFWTVESPDTVELFPVRTDEVRVGYQVTSPERRMPEAVFETADGRVFAMKSEAARELDYYGVKIERRRDSSAGGNTVGLLGHRALLLYTLDSVESVAATVDRQKARQVPCDLFCEVLRPEEMSTPAYVTSFVERINAVRSRRPVQVLTFDESGSFPEGMEEDATVAPVARRVLGTNASVLEEMTRLLVPA